jgi:hypothetical protein
MQMFKNCFLILLLSVPSVAPCATLVRIKSGTLAGVTLQNLGGVALSAGSGGAGDGALLELGYYSLAADADPFAGSWTALTGSGSASLIVTTIGDVAVSDGRFALDFTLDYSLAGLPQDGTPLAVRFYDSTTRATSTFFNAVSNTNGEWNWNTSGNQIDILVGNIAGTVWQGGAGSAFRTTVAVPEPSALILMGCGALIWAGRRWRNTSTCV